MSETKSDVYPKILVISNECFSRNSSNGRTLGNFFVGWPKNCLAQFCLRGVPDSYYCDNYFKITDRQALKAFLGKRQDGGIVLKSELSSKQKLESGIKEAPKNALTMLGRNLIWNSGKWEKSGYWKWTNKFQPDIILLQAGDCAFMYRLAMKTAKRFNAKLVIYNSEAYYYKRFDYFRGHGVAHALYPLFYSHLRKNLEHAYKKASCIIYICDELEQQYAKDFSVRSETVFTGSEVHYEEKKKENPVFKTAYCGNLGLNRHESLIEIAGILQNISSDLYIDVYGKVTSYKVEKELHSSKGIHFHGLVEYDQVKNMLRDSDLLLYVESFDSFYQEDVKFGFSTKIADSLASGNCFLLYAPEQFACYQYLKKNQAAFTASSKTELQDVLNDIVKHPETRIKYRQAALNLADKNHDVEKNRKKFQNILLKV